ncbi:MAG: glycerol kinase [Anaerolineaceae bacterium]|jgi:glycerol kinase|nr:MAG: glycerol kinase [Anaerolineaceae bacterium]
MADYIASIDQGTTSTRCMLFNVKGEVVGSHQLEHAQIYPQPGWVEHNPNEIWARTQDVIVEAMRNAGARAEDVAAIGVTNQRETTIVWDKTTGKIFYNAIVWQDTRTDKIIQELGQEGGQSRFQTQVGLPLATYFSGPKIKWILDNVDGVREAAQAGRAIFGNMDTWLIWNLTGGVEGGVHVTDVTNASRTMLMDLKTLQWDEAICRVMGIPLQMLPEICPSSRIYGYTRPDGPFGGIIPVAGDLGDQQAATVGQACFDVGEAKNTYGTGCFMILNTGHEIVLSKNGLLTTVCYQFKEEKPVYALEGSIAITGALVQWLRDNLKMISSAPEIEDLAKTVDDNGGMYLVPAFSGLFAPYWRSDARGVIVGLTRYVNRGHFARAVLEATAFQTREVLEAMKADSNVDLLVLKVDGGMVQNDLLMQIQADVLQVPVIRPKVAETTALGAAYAAGYAVDFWKDLNEMRSNWKKDKVWTPKLLSPLHTEKFKEWKKAVTRTFDWVD